MHVCICTRTDVFVMMSECSVKSRLVALCLRCVTIWSKATAKTTSSLSSHHNKNSLQWLYSRRGRIFPPIIVTIIIIILKPVF